MREEEGAPADAAAASASASVSASDMPDKNWTPNNQSSWELVSNRAVEKFRLAVRPQVPPTYSGPRHLASIEAVCATVIVLCLVLTRTDDAGLLGAFADAAFWLTFALTCVFANGMEYYLHKNLMHPPGRHTRHSALHHRFFTNTRMALDDFRADPNAILFHPRAAPVFFGLILPVAAALLGLLTHWRVGVYFEMTGAFYYASYELLHLAYHMDEKQYPVLRLIPFLPFLRRHHLIHHYQPYMRHVNFNITVPLFDALCGTLVTALPAPSPAQASAALDAEADAAGGAVGKPPKW